MAEHALSLSDFAFPPNLPNSRANFRFVIDIRFEDEKGNFTTQNVVMPGLDTFWECDPGKRGDPNYVRLRNEAKFDMSPDVINEWDRLVLRLRPKM